MSTTDGWFETQLCKLRDTSDTLIGRASAVVPGIIEGSRKLYHHYHSAAEAVDRRQHRYTIF